MWRADGFVTLWRRHRRATRAILDGRPDGLPCRRILQPRGGVAALPAWPSPLQYSVRRRQERFRVGRDLMCAAAAECRHLANTLCRRRTLPQPRPPPPPPHRLPLHRASSTGPPLHRASHPRATLAGPTRSAHARSHSSPTAPPPCERPCPATTPPPPPPPPPPPAAPSGAVASALTARRRCPHRRCVVLDQRDVGRARRRQ